MEEIPHGNLTELTSDAVTRIGAADSLEELEAARIHFLGKNGALTRVLRSLGALPPGERARIGQEANRARDRVEDMLQKRKGELASVRKGPKPDLTLPGLRPRRGAVHPIHQTIREISDIFKSLGFEIVQGREVETEFHNFTALNIPLDHPSRDAFDTFYTRCGNLLRSQTSTVQIRVMQNRKPPLRILAPGRVYRPDTVDASHSFMFHQIEGLLVDDRVTFSDLKGLINLFLRRLFGTKTRTRFRPHFFPFTEPSVEVDVSWETKDSASRKSERWLEVMGAGMVDPAVFREVGYPAGTCQGLAFGLGVERIAMLRYGIDDIRLFYENSVHFLEQFA